MFMSGCLCGCGCGRVVVMVGVFNIYFHYLVSIKVILSIRHQCGCECDFRMDKELVRG